jgi:Family of unknown function (DUF6627)
MNDRMCPAVSRFFAASLFGFALCCGTASAEMVGTDDAAASAEPANPNADREKVRAFMERPEVVKQLQKMGVSPDEARARVGAMSDAEVRLVAGKLDMLPAGGRLTDFQLIVIILLGVIALVLIL